MAINFYPPRVRSKKSNLLEVWVKGDLTCDLAHVLRRSKRPALTILEIEERLDRNYPIQSIRTVLANHITYSPGSAHWERVERGAYRKRSATG